MGTLDTRKGFAVTDEDAPTRQQFLLDAHMSGLPVTWTAERPSDRGSELVRGARAIAQLYAFENGAWAPISEQVVLANGVPTLINFKASNDSRPAALRLTGMTRGTWVLSADSAIAMVGAAPNAAEMQPAWYIDPVGGHDGADGATATSALKTWAEFVRRVRTVSVAMTVTILGSLSEPLRGTFQASRPGAALTIAGAPTVLASGSTSTFVDPVPATNTRGTVTVTDLTNSGGPTNFTGYVGKMLRATVAGSYKHLPVLRAAAGVAQGGYWCQDLSNALPANGSLVEVLDLVTTPTAQIYAFGLPVRVEYLKFTSVSTGDVPFVATFLPLVGLSGTVLQGAFSACEFAQSIGANPGGVTWVLGCLFGAGGASSIIAMGGSMSFIGGGSLRSLFTNVPGKVRFQGFTFQGGGLVVGGTSAGTSSSAGPVCVEALSATTGLGIFDAPGDAITVMNDSSLSVASPYGSGSAGRGLVTMLGGFTRVTGNPTITGATGDLLFDGDPNAIPPLVAGAVVPAAAPLTTWAQWAAAPFSRNVVSYKTASRIIGA